jgi:hypothetical protein
MPITTSHDIFGDLAQQVYSLTRAHEITLSAELQAAWDTLRAEYPDLPVDEHLPDGGRYRFRRWGRVWFLPKTDELIPMPHTDYFQSKDYNRVTGGIVRRFAPLKPEMFDNLFLQALIRFNMNNFPTSERAKSEAWQVDIHMIRVIAGEGIHGQPTPEGIHRDGAAFVTVHLAELENAGGGDVTLYDNAACPIVSFRLNRPLDSYFFDDSEVLHGVTPIYPEDSTAGAVRSILTFDYHHRPDLERPEED